MNNGVTIIMFVSYIIIGTPMNQPIPEPESMIEISELFCSSCEEHIPNTHNHFKVKCPDQDADHLVCTHCYFYRLPKDPEGHTVPACEYVTINGADMCPDLHNDDKK
jgi:hypothetical protein